MSAQTCNCTEDQILAYVAGDLGDRDAVAVAEHLGECLECREQAVEFTALGRALPDCCRAEAIRWHSFETPFGSMYVAATDHGLARLTWSQPSPERFVGQMERRFPGHPVIQDSEHEALREAERQLREYFAGERSAFELPVDLSMLSEFEQKVLAVARRIPFGEVLAYSDIARRIGKPTASRAVGNALGKNPVAIVVPCHRVLRRDGRIGGYGGGVEYKRQLLTIEGRPDLAHAG